MDLTKKLKSKSTQTKKFSKAKKKMIAGEIAKNITL
jgi:hypothetical protein